VKIAPLDLRQQRFGTALRGFDRTDVMTFLSEAADDYEQALRQVDHLRDDVNRLEEQLREHREREATLRNTLTTAQKLADEIREGAKQEAKVILRDAHNRADLVLQKAQARLDEFDRQVTELRLKRRDVESSLEASIAALRHAVDFIRATERPDRDDKIRLYRPRPAEGNNEAAAHGPAAGADLTQRPA